MDIMINHNHSIRVVQEIKTKSIYMKKKIGTLSLIKKKSLKKIKSKPKKHIIKNKNSDQKLKTDENNIPSSLQGTPISDEAAMVAGVETPSTRPQTQVRPLPMPQVQQVQQVQPLLSYNSANANTNTNTGNLITVLTITNETPKWDPNKKKRYYFCDHLYYSHLDFQYYRKQIEIMGWERTNDPSKASLILSSYFKYFDKYKKMENKPRLALWTHEPYHDWCFEKMKDQVQILNVYTGTVFKDNYRYFRWDNTHRLNLVTTTETTLGGHLISEEIFKTRKFPLLALSTKYPVNYYQNNRKSLLPRRYQIIEWGLANKKARVWGKGWGKLAVGESRTADDREEKKANILAKGLFNIAVENTDAANYVTEKIWESIENYCLPIYWSNSTIYKDFPSDSFIDARLFYKESPDKWVSKLYEFIQNMTLQQYITRLNKCITVFNNLCSKGLTKNLRTDCTNQQLHIVDYSRNWIDFKQLFA